MGLSCARQDPGYRKKGISLAIAFAFKRLYAVIIVSIHAYLDTGFALCELGIPYLLAFAVLNPAFCVLQASVSHPINGRANIGRIGAAFDIQPMAIFQCAFSCGICHIIV
jgi:hypothetical protein